MSVKLERIYLLNVLLYIDSLESVKKFITINKKCQEVSTMLRLYTKRRKYDSDFDHEKMIPKNLFTLFPMIQTIQCDYYDILDNKEIMENVTFINLNGTRWFNEKEIEKEIEKEMRNKVKSLKIWRSVSYSDLSTVIELYPNCKTIITENFQFEKILGRNTNVKLDHLIVKSKGYHEEFEQLKRYTNIEQKSLIPEELKYYKRNTKNWYIEQFEEEHKEREEVIQLIKNVFDNHPYQIVENYIPVEYYPLETEEISIQNIIDNLNKYYPYYSIKHINLRQYTHLKRLTSSNKNESMKVGKVLIEGLTNIESFGNIQDMEIFDITEIPNSVTRLEFNKSEMEQPIQFSEYPNVKAVKFNYLCEEKLNITVDNEWKEFDFILNTLQSPPIELEELIFEITAILADF